MAEAQEETTNVETNVETNVAPNIKIEPSNFTSHYFTASVGESTYGFRILKMVRSMFIYIGPSESEIFDEIGVGIPLHIHAKNFSSTTVYGPQLGCNSEEFALRLSKRLKKQIYLSCNVPTDRIIRPKIEQRIFYEINKHPEHFE